LAGGRSAGGLAGGRVAAWTRGMTDKAGVFAGQTGVTWSVSVVESEGAETGVGVTSTGEGVWFAPTHRGKPYPSQADSNLTSSKGVSSEGQHSQHIWASS
jgi:hypothetical protein